MPDVESAECPVSRISADSKLLISLYLRNRRMKESMGASVYGTDYSKWPAWMVDAFDLIERESLAYDQYRDEAMKR